MAGSAPELPARYLALQAVCFVQRRGVRFGVVA